MARTELAEKLEIIGTMLEIDGMTDLLDKFKAGISNVRFNAVLIQIESLLMKDAPKTADKLIAMNREISEDEVAKLEDTEYARALKDAIVTEVFGFFASSPHTDGKK